eukprot:TRINITY_DN1117_c0_g1_i1.p1 TRINITY_DN1117_c0_g1~~TRINITY_DN1117_c0_g1_i1.p1  ORF type:complete len:340 (+),score=47.67 TRINITY_DN1117_c0_g1_i1:458-1477(+)
MSQSSVSLTRRDSADMAACLQILLDTQSFEDFPFEDFFDPEKLLVDPKDAEGLLLGRGGEATCFLGTLKGRSVAVKTSYSDSVLREYSFIHGLNHPNIIKTAGFTLIPSSIITEEFSTGESETRSNDGDVMFLACYEYAANKDLASYLHDHPEKRKDDTFVTSALDSILAGLQYLHDRQILHGDIKPENILIMENERTCIADFGLCQTMSDDMIAQGTPSYMAPEVLASWCNLSKVSFSAAADIFSFGVLVVRSLTGKYPFARITARLHQRVKFSAAELEGFFQTPQDVMRQLDTVSPKYAVLAKLCLRIDPEERPSAADLRKVLQQLTSDVPKHGTSL